MPVFERQRGEVGLRCQRADDQRSAGPDENAGCRRRAAGKDVRPCDDKVQHLRLASPDRLAYQRFRGMGEAVKAEGDDPEDDENELRCGE